MTLEPVPRSLVAVDIEGYSGRDNLGHLELRNALRRVCDEAFARIGVSPDARQDQGDAFLFLIPPDVPKAHLVSDLIRELGTALRLSNRNWRADARMRLRVALHAGEVHLDGTGYGGESVVTVARLIDADPLKEALKTTPGDLAVIVSDQLYGDVVRQEYRDSDPADYTRVHVSRKEFSQPAWVRVPGARPPYVGPGAAPVARPPGRGPEEPGAPWPSAAAAGNMPFAGTMTFHGPTSFGGPAAGRDVNAAGRDMDIRKNQRDD
jgi:class 3 adenylate cyclase